MPKSKYTKRADGRYVYAYTDILTAKRKYIYGSSPREIDQKLREMHARAEMGRTFAQVAEKLNKAGDTDLLDAAADLIGEIGDDAQRAELGDLYRARRDELSQ